MQKSLGQKIKELRLSLGMTQGELGKNLATPSMISQIEADKASPSHKLLAELAERLGVTLQYFLEDIQNKLERNETFKYARMLMEAENYKGAVQLLTELLHNPAPHLNPFEIQLDLAFSMQKLGQTDSSLTMYESIVEESLSQAEFTYCVKALQAMGSLEYERGNLVLAHFHLSKATTIGMREIENDSELVSDVLLKLARAQNKLGDHTKALDTINNLQKFRTAISDLQKGALVSQTFCEIYKDMGRYQEAIEFAKTAISQYQQLGLPLQVTHMNITLAQILDENRSPEEALHVLEACIERANPDLLEEIPYIYTVMAGIFLRLERLETGKAYCEKALATAGDEYDTLIPAYRTLAEISLKLNKFQEAVYNCEQAIHLSQKQHRIADLSRSFTVLCNIFKQEGNYLSATETFLRMQQSIEHHMREISLTR